MSFYFWRLIPLFFLIILVKELNSYNFKIESNSALKPESTSFINFENGDYIIFYQNSTKDTNQINLLKFDRENTILFERELNPSKTFFENEINPKAISLTNDTFLLIWQKFNSINDDYVNNFRNDLVIYAQIFDRDFNTIGDQFNITEGDTCLLENKSILKISDNLFAIVFMEFQNSENAYHAICNIFTTNGVNVKRENLFTTQNITDLNINYLNNTSFLISYLPNNPSKEKSPNRTLNNTIINHNALEYDKYIIEKKQNISILSSNGTNIDNFNFTLNTTQIVYEFKKYTTKNNYNILIFRNSKILNDNLEYINSSYFNYTSINKNNSSYVNITSNNQTTQRFLLDMNKTSEKNLIGIVSSFDNLSYSYNGFTLLNSYNNSYIEINIVDYDFNHYFTRYYKIENGCNFDSLVFPDGNFILTWQYDYSTKYNNSPFSNAVYMEFNSNLNMKYSKEKVIIPQANNITKYNPKIYYFENLKNDFKEKKILLSFKTYDVIDHTYQMYFSTQNCKQTTCIEDYILLKECSKNCKSCIGNSFICTKCSPEFFPLYGGVLTDPNFDLLNSINNNKMVSVIMNPNMTSVNNILSAFNCFTLENPPPNSYFDGTNMVFFKCDDSCNKCSNSPIECKTCNFKDDYYPLEDRESQCVKGSYFYDEQFKRGYFLDYRTLKMKKCNNECKSCKNFQDNCIDCNNDFGYFTTSDRFIKCQKNPSGYYLDSVNRIYRKCIENCIKCQNEITCENCDDYSTLIFNKKKCHFCGESMFYDENKNVCRDCNEIGFCKSCNIDGCLECRDHFEFNPITVPIDSNSKNSGILINFRFMLLIYKFSKK